MGFDLHGMNPKNAAGEYFRAQIWQWPPILALLWQLNVIDEEEAYHYSYNERDEVEKDKAKKMATAIEEYLKTHNEAFVNNMGKPSKDAGFMQLIKRDVQGEPENYGANRSDLAEFMMFCKYCGGFTIH